MASKRNVRRRSCQNKRRWDTKEEAEQNGKFGGMQTYKCEFGDHFHVGHPPRPTKVAIKKRRQRQ